MFLGETEAGLGPQGNVRDREMGQDQKPFLLSLSSLRVATGTVSLKTLLKGPLKAGVGKLGPADQICLPSVSIKKSCIEV